MKNYQNLQWFKTKYVSKMDFSLTIQKTKMNNFRDMNEIPGHWQ